jgi:hypothetical protein
MGVEDLIIPSIEESIDKTSVRDYEVVEKRYYEHYYWCPGFKKPQLKNEKNPDEGVEMKEDPLLSQIKSNLSFILQIS